MLLAASAATLAVSDRRRTGLVMQVLVDSMGMARGDDGGLWAAMLQDILDDEQADYRVQMRLTHKVFQVWWRSV